VHSAVQAERYGIVGERPLPKRERCDAKRASAVALERSAVIPSAGARGDSEGSHVRTSRWPWV